MVTLVYVLVPHCSPQAVRVLVPSMADPGSRGLALMMVLVMRVRDMEETRRQLLLHMTMMTVIGRYGNVWYDRIMLLAVVWCCSLY